MSQEERLLKFLADRGDRGATSLEIVLMLKILNTTGRVSDLRAKGHSIICKKDGACFKFIYKGSHGPYKKRDDLTAEEKAWVG